MSQKNEPILKMNIKHFFSKEYLFGISSGENFTLALIVFGGIILISLILWLANFKIEEKPKKKLIGRFANWAFTIGAGGLLIVFLQRQAIPTLSARIMLGLWLFAGLIWLFFILFYLVFKFPREIDKHQRFITKAKYLHKNETKNLKFLRED